MAGVATIVSTPRVRIIVTVTAVDTMRQTAIIVKVCFMVYNYSETGIVMVISMHFFSARKQSANTLAQASLGDREIKAKKHQDQDIL